MNVNGIFVIYGLLEINGIFQSLNNLVLPHWNIIFNE